MRILLTLLVGLLIILSTNAEDKLTLSITENSINIGLDNDASFTAFQMDIIIPQGMTKTAVTPASRIASPSFVVDSEMIESNILRVITYNTENQAISGNTGELVNIALASALAATDVIEVRNIRIVKVENLNEVMLTNIEIGGAESSDIATAIHNMAVNADDATVYSVTGQTMPMKQRGMNIVRTKNGDVVKVAVK